jgi:uncharacterized OB-fold protein
MSRSGSPYPPRDSAIVRRFLAHLAEGELATTRCVACGHTTFPPKHLCPRCWATKLEWVTLTAEGSLASFTELHAVPGLFATEAPYVLGVVDLNDGVRCLGRVVGGFDELSCGQRLCLDFERSAAQSYLVFAVTDPSPGDLVDQSPREALGGIDDLAGERQPTRSLPPDPSRDAHGSTGARDEAHSELREREHGVGLGLYPSGERRQFDTGTDTRPVDVSGDTAR